MQLIQGEQSWPSYLQLANTLQTHACEFTFVASCLRIHTCTCLYLTDSSCRVTFDGYFSCNRAWRTQTRRIALCKFVHADQYLADLFLIQRSLSGPTQPRSLKTRLTDCLTYNMVLTDSHFKDGPYGLMLIDDPAKLYLDNNPFGFKLGGLSCVRIHSGMVTHSCELS